MSKKLRTAILGASGYTGAELIRLLHNHPVFEIAALTGDSQAGKEMAAVYPHLRVRDLPKLVKHSQVDFAKIDFVFCCLPHGTTQEIIAGLPPSIRIVDLSADFRLDSPADYKEWYGHAHHAVKLQKTAIYGLTEFNRDAVKKARLVANPGCYPTSILLPMLPLVKEKLVIPMSIGADSLSGISGAGRGAKQEMLFTELDGGVAAYSVGRHRHMAEIDQELNKVSGEKNTVSFTPHLVPMSRGMLSTIHAGMTKGTTVDQVRDVLKKRYKNEPFVRVLSDGSPSSAQVRGTNYCFMSVHAGRIPGELIIISVIDNLVKGASGQALQNANLMAGVPETTNLDLTAIFP